MGAVNHTQTRLQNIDQVRKEPYTVTSRLSWQKDTHIWERSTVPKHEKSEVK